MAAEQLIAKKISEPFIGPRSFTLAEKDIFFGRDPETQRIVSLILSNQEILIYSQSGAGKTSILNAKVLPETEMYGMKALPTARVNGTVKPDEASMTISNIYIFNTLRYLDPKIDPKLAATISLTDFLAQYTSNDNREIPRIIIFDQFEELFATYVKNYPQQRQEFFQQIADAIRADPLLKVVFVIREEHLAELEKYSSILPDRLRTRFHLELLHREAAVLAVKGPLTEFEYHDNANLVADRIVDDLLDTKIHDLFGNDLHTPGEYVEPVHLQVVCQRLWRKGLLADQNSISQTSLGKVDEALKEFYVNAVQKTSKETGIYEGDIRIWVEKKLITSSRTRNFIHEELEFTSGIPNKVLDLLESNYLIRGEWRSGAKWYELTHDRLIDPVLDSNGVWKNNLQSHLRHRRKIGNIKKIIVSIAIISVIMSLAIVAMNPQNPNLVAKIPIDRNPHYVAVNPLTNLIYVAGPDDNTISVINGTSQTVISNNILVGTDPRDIAVDPNTNLIYLIDKSHQNGTVFVINGGTQKVTGKISVGPNPYGLAVDPNTNLIYVADYNDGTVTVINGTTEKIIKNIFVGNKAVAIGVNPVTNLVYVANSADGTLSLINGTSLKLVKRDIEIGSNPIALAVNPSSDLIYVIYDEDGDGYNYDLAVINGTTHMPVENDIVLNGFALDLNPNLNLIYVINHNNNTVSVINGTNQKIISKSITIGPSPGDIAVNPKTNLVYITNNNDNALSVINPKLRAPQSRSISTLSVHNNSYFTPTISYPDDIKVGYKPISLALDPFSNKIYVANYEDGSDGTVTVIDGKTHNIIKKIELDSSPHFISINPVTDMIYLDSDTDTVSVIDGKTNGMKAKINIGSSIQGIAVDPSTNLIFIATQSSNELKGFVWVINGTSNELLGHYSRVGSYPDYWGSFIIPSNNSIYLTDFNNETISIINHSSHSIDNVLIGSSPYEIYADPYANRIYVSNDANTVSVIDGKTRHILSNISVGHGSHAISGNPVSGLIYVTNYDDDTVSVIDGKTNRLISDIKVGNGPGALAVNPFSNTVYVANYMGGTVSVIDGKTNSVTDNRIKVRIDPSSITFNPSNNLIYLANIDSDTVSVIDGKTNRLISDIKVGNGPVALALNPVSNSVYVANYRDGTVSVIDGKTNRLIKNGIQVGNAPYAITVNPSANLIYVSDFYEDNIRLISGKTNKLVGLIDANAAGSDIEFNPSTNLIYVVDYSQGKISVLDGKTNKMTNDSIEVGSHPSDLAVNPNSNLIYVANSDSDTVSVIDGGKNKLMLDIAVANPYSLYVNPSTNMIYVTHYVSNTVSIINGITNSVIKDNLEVGQNPYGIIGDSISNNIFVADSGEQKLSIIKGPIN